VSSTAKVVTLVESMSQFSLCLKGTDDPGNGGRWSLLDSALGLLVFNGILLPLIVSFCLCVVCVFALACLKCKSMLGHLLL